MITKATDLQDAKDLTHLAELLLAIFAWMAHAESQRRSERTKAGLARRKAVHIWPSAPLRLSASGGEWVTDLPEWSCSRS
jgi:DNA invertase Pin-like site-specific DNA recombinase